MVRFILSSGVFGIIIFILGVVGWIMNVFKVIHHISDPLTAMEILRMIGVVFAPLGAILGFC